MEKNGDDFLSGQDRELWALVYSTVLKFSCCTIFRKIGPFAPTYKDCTITFFVPRHHPLAAEVKAYLEHEAKSLIYVARQTEEDWYPNTYVRVMLYSGLDYHLDRDVSEEMASQFADSVLTSLRDFHKKLKDEPDA